MQKSSKQKLLSLYGTSCFDQLFFLGLVRILIVNLFLLMPPNLSFGKPARMPDDKNALPWHNLKLGRTEISFGGSYRLRGEMQKEFHIKAFGTGKTENFLLSRLRFNTNIQFTPQLRLHFQLQDAQAFGLSFTDRDFAAGNNPFHDPLDLNQAFVEYQPLEPVKFKIGRQPISFRDRRIFGPGDWGNTGRYAWDAAMLTLMNRHLESHWIIGRFILHDPDRWPNRRAQGPTGYASYNSIKTLPFLLDVFYVFKHDDRGLTQGEKEAGNLASHSFGFWLYGKSKSLGYGVTAVGQIGRWSSDKIRAYGLVFALGYHPNLNWKPEVSIQSIIGSGDKNPNDGIHGTFDGVFGGADTDLYGWMNLFFWQNLREYRLDLKLAPNKRLNLKGEYHYFMLDAPRDAWYFPGKALRRDQTGSSGQALGHEIDVTARIKIWDYLELLAGSGIFLPGKFVKQTGRSPAARWHFLETTLSF
jgi:hypothetical protein